jgi:hypothetical protein
MNELEANRFLGRLIEAARAQPGGVMQITDGAGAVVAEVRTFKTAPRPQDMPRHLRPKLKLSKRQRTAAKHEKLAHR